MDQARELPYDERPANRDLSHMRGDAKLQHFPFTRPLDNLPLRLVARQPAYQNKV